MRSALRLWWLRVKLRGLSREREHYRAQRRGLRVALLRVDVDERITRQQIASEIERQRQERFDQMWRETFRFPPGPE